MNIEEIKQRNDFMFLKMFIFIIACTAFCLPAFGRMSPPRLHMDELLDCSSLIVVGRVEVGSFGQSVGKTGQTARELTLVISKIIKGKHKPSTVNVTCGTFPIKEFPKTEKRPKSKLLLTGWGMSGHTSGQEKGLDLYAEQVWFLRIMPRHYLVLPDKAPYGVHNEAAVQELKYLPLISLFLKKAGSKEIRDLIAKSFDGKIPLMAVQYFRDSTDPDAGQIAWDYLHQENGHAGHAFRTINSLPRDEALKWCRKGLFAAKRGARSSALEGMKTHSDIESIPEIVELLKQEKNNDQKERLVKALGAIGDVKAVPVLIELMKHKDTENNRYTWTWQYAREALHEITEVWLDPNGDAAIKWWERNKDKPRWYRLKQGIEQDLEIMDRVKESNYTAEVSPYKHLSFATLHTEPFARKSTEETRRERLENWRKWWKENKDLPQERWVLDSLRDAGYDIQALDNSSIDVFIKALNTRYRGGWTKDQLTWTHQVWCHRFLTRLTGLTVRDSRYTFYSGKDSFVDWKIYGPMWKDTWEKNRDKVEVKPIKIPTEQKFEFDKKDRELLCGHFNTLKADIVFKGPLVRTKKKGPVTGTFEITVTNESKNDVTIHTNPPKSGQNGYSYGSGGTLSIPKFECTSHNAAFISIAPGKSLKWVSLARLSNWGRGDLSWVMFRLVFKKSGKDGKGWRGAVRTPWISVKKENIIDKEIEKKGK